MPANSEQIKAIEHNGGVLLKAGAGSGKTFVLIEHLVYLIESNIFRNGTLVSKDKEILKNILKEKLSPVVLMTFTRKAAGELAIRLSNKIKKLEIENLDQEFNCWSIVRECVDYITISTIDGFCYKLIKEGYLLDFPPEVRIIETIEFNSKIETLFNEWMEFFSPKENKIVDLVLFHRSNVLTSLEKIFGTPELRILWSDNKGKDLSWQNFESIFDKTLEYADLKEVLINYPYHGSYPDFSKTPWCQFLEKYDDLLKQELPLFEKVNLALEFIKSFKRLPTKPKDILEVSEFFEKISEFRKFFQNNLSYYLAFKENYKTHIGPWNQILNHIVQYIDQNYLKIPGITFSDLEYYVLQAVRNKNISNRILERYKYFIVDEFQDTSFVQFEIIEQIINGDFSKLFCVGDIKQAIYGFKGGEIKVFKDCEEKTPLVLELKNNYRSKPNIIKFNNYFFDYLFKLGMSFEGHDLDPVEVVHQLVPSEKSFSNSGHVAQLLCRINNQSDEEELKLNKNQIDRFEAEVIFEDIMKRQIQSDYKQSAILYRKLGPSILLINLLLENKKGFSAQIKIPFSQDPIWGMFRTLVEFYFDLNVVKRKKNNSNEYKFVEFMLQNYLKVLNFNQLDLKDKILKFYQNVNYFGLSVSYEMFLYSLGIVTSNQDNNLLKIKSLVDSSSSIDQLLHLMDISKDEKYSIEFQAGKDLKKIIIMTAHASKGLQFDTVYLGGVYTNGKDQGMSGSMGKFPGSFKWHLDKKSKSSYKTPYYIFEELFERNKNFSESKRLFYVATTRAESSLFWVAFDFNGCKYSVNKNSWINGIQSWILNANSKDETELLSEINNKDLVFQRIIGQNTEETDDEQSEDENEEMKVPLFHRDNLGIVQKENNQKELFFLPELSVTKASIVAQCPRKFYLKNICKFDDSDIELLSLVATQDFDYFKPTEFIEEENENINFIKASDRGTNLHGALEKIIKNNFVISDDEILNQKDSSAIYWAIEKIKESSLTAQIFPEKEFKFSLFGHMISGIADLIIIDQKNKFFGVFDYKTGKRKEHSEVGYWFQLYCYAFALYQLNIVDSNDQINLKLLYIDQKQAVDRTLGKSEIEKFLRSEWSKTQFPDEINPQHCQHCQFQKFCQ